MASENWGIYYILKMLFKSLIIFHNVSVFNCNFNKWNATFVSIRDCLQKHKENPTDPTFLNGSVHYWVLLRFYVFSLNKFPEREKSLSMTEAVWRIVRV